MKIPALNVNTLNKLKKNNMNNTEVSKFLSFILRHQPDSIGLTVDSEGWADIEELMAKAKSNGKHFSRAQLDEVVATNDKKRFSISDDGRQIRAAQGHSNKVVSIQYQAQTPPAVLYHGTASRFITSIMEQGLLAQNRHHVHLSQDLDTARKVGSRHGVPVILRIDTAAMLACGHSFYLADNDVWLTEQVPPQFLQRLP